MQSDLAGTSRFVDDKLTVEKVLRSLAIFSGDLSPKEIYAQENRQALKERADEIVGERGQQLPPGCRKEYGVV